MWEGDFKAGTVFPRGTRHVFAPHNKQGEYNTVLGDCRGSFHVLLFWTDPLFSPSNQQTDLSDFELYASDTIGNHAEDTTTHKLGSSPYRSLVVPGLRSTDPNRTVWIEIVKTAGKADRFLHLETKCGRLQYSTSGVTRGHNAAANTISVAAKSANKQDIPFEDGENVNYFSAEGPRRMFFKPDGSPYNSRSRVSDAAEVLQKPDFTAADGVTTDVFGFNPFWGTSAAAPQIAGIAALMWSKNASLTADQIKSALRQSAIPIENTEGWNSRSGFGIIKADAALRAMDQTEDQTERDAGLTNSRPVAASGKRR